MTHHILLDTLSEALQQEMQASLGVMTFPAGKVLFSAGDLCQGLPLVLGGSIKVQMTGLSGHSIVLYRMGAAWII
ncbi:hypothetical protein [Marinobacter salinexigens]|uniref:hypothetical protein n=1 Tax=Marinobacter salinexigens TaxID=2919747 RepID=UPI001FE54A28|nr:hypothetical protein [Marinobacter salinexigens]